MLVVIEGIDFAGKTTQLKFLADALRTTGREVLTCSYPAVSKATSVPLRAALRKDIVLPAEAMFALFAANRLETKPEILAALAQGRTVLCDRYSESEYAYGMARGLDPDWLVALESRMPAADLVILLDIDYDVAIQRKPESRQLDVFEEDRTYMRAVREEYLKLANANETSCCRWLTIDASMALDSVRRRIVDAVMNRLSKRHWAGR
jgi:dTMP kinase